MVKEAAARTGVREGEIRLSHGASDIPPLVLGAGEDDYLRRRLVRAFRSGGEAEGAEFVRLEGDTLEASDLAQALQAITLFGGTRRIWIREGAKLERAAEAQLLEWAAGPAEGARVLATSARRVEDLKSLQSLASRGLRIDCAATARERREWLAEILKDAGLKLPAQAVETLAARTLSLAALEQEAAKLTAHADETGRVPSEALEALAYGRDEASPARWAEALLRGDAPAAHAEAIALDAEGTSGSSCLWAVADIAFGALDAQAFAYRRGPSARVDLGPREARAVLDAVYAADRAMKRGEIRDAEIRIRLEDLLGGMNRVRQ